MNFGLFFYFSNLIENSLELDFPRLLPDFYSKTAEAAGSGSDLDSYHSVRRHPCSIDQTNWAKEVDCPLDFENWHQTPPAASSTARPQTGSPTLMPYAATPRSSQQAKDSSNASTAPLHHNAPSDSPIHYLTHS